MPCIIFDKKSVKAPFFPICISGEFSQKNVSAFVTDKISVPNLLAAAIATDLSFDGAVNANWRIFQRQFTGASRKSILVWLFSPQLT
jgi:hypothetical protein